MNNISEQISENWNGFRIEKVNESHYPALSHLLNSTFSSGFSTDYLQKKYATDVFNGKNVGYLAFDGDLAVSHQLGLAVPLCYQNKNFLSLQSCDSATHPNYGKRGLWVALNEFMFRQIEKDKIVGIFGFPNQNSHPIFINKLGYTEAESLKSYQIKIHKIPFWKIFHRLKSEKLLTQLAQNSFKKYQIAPISFSSFDENLHLIINRSLAYLTYKIKMGSFFMQLHDTIFWVKIKGGNLFIGDLKTPSELHFNNAMNELKTICYRSGLSNIIFQSHSGSFEESLFAKKYASMETTPMIYRIFSGEIPYHLLKCTYADLDTF